MVGTLNDQHFTSTVLQPFHPTLGVILSMRLTEWCSDGLDSYHILPLSRHNNLTIMAGAIVETVLLLPAVAIDWLGESSRALLVCLPTPNV